MKHLLLAFIFIASCAQSTGAATQLVFKTKGAAPTSVVQTEQVRAELIAHAPDGIQPGQTIWLGLQMQHQPHWHTYWKNPGDSGLATTLQWTLPAGTEAGEIVWPTPQRLIVANMVNYGYSDNLLLPVPLKIAPNFSPSAGGELEVRLAASWLVCKQECVPQEGQFVLRIPTKGSSAGHGALFEAARVASPFTTNATGQAVLNGNNLLVRISGLPSAWQGKAISAFPELPDVAESATAAHGGDRIGPVGTPPTLGSQVWSEGSWSAVLPLSPQRETSPQQLPLVLVSGNQSLRTVIAITGTWPSLPTVQPPLPAPGEAVGGAVGVAAAVPSTPIAATGLNAWLLAMAAAVLGGLILNLMPCVLPVLAIKVLGFSHHSAQPQDVQNAHRAQGLAYTAGVVLSFVGLGALMLALRAGGEQLGWGFQLQSPPVLVALAMLFTLIGLNLAGLFEVGMLLPHKLVSLQARHPVVDAFLSGVLAVAIASPCTAPFMGASLGYAISLPALQALGIFAALGLGLALPFLAAAFVPAVASWLPKPGAWMDTLRRFLAFPMFATVIWLVWVLGHLSGVDGASALLALLLMLSLVIWSLTLEGRSRLIIAALSIAVSAVLASSIGPLALQVDEPSSSTTSSAPPATSGSQWQAWSPGKVEAELAAGRSVFIDFTAAWCITCQYNKKTTLSKPDVLAAFAAHKVTLLRADWTRRDPTITAALEQLGRNGVPVYVLHQSGKPPMVFSEILDATTLHAALANLSN